jgi:hypothetical protein
VTPLLHRIAKELTLPVKERTFQDSVGLLPMLSDVHSFEVTEVTDMAGQLALDMVDRANKTGRLDLLETQNFLPAPKTWIERRSEDGNREGYLFIASEDGAQARVVTVGECVDRGTWGTLPYSGSIALKVSDPRLDAGEWQRIWPAEADSIVPGSSVGMTLWFYAVLAMINSPRVIGRTQPGGGARRGTEGSRAPCIHGRAARGSG